MSSMLLLGILLCVLLLALIYGGLVPVLRILVWLRLLAGRRTEPTRWQDLEKEHLPRVTIFVPARDEQGRIGQRLDNLAALDYPPQLLEIIVGSDGSTDDTVKEAEQWFAAHPGYRGYVRAFAQNTGRARMQNWAAIVARHEIFLNTDVETRFEPSTLTKLVAPFTDPAIGAVGAHIFYAAKPGSAVGALYHSYRRMEYALREIETQLGLCAKSDGPCTAMRTALWRPIAPFEDIDYAVPLVCRKQGKKLVYVKEAIAQDVANETAEQEFRQRSRMAIRTLSSFGYHWTARLAFLHLAFTFVFMAHKILRLFSPFIGLALLVLVPLHGAIAGYLAILAGLAIGVLTMAVLAHILPGGKRYVRMARALAISNAAYAVGVMRALRGEKVESYLPTHALNRTGEKD